MKKREAARLLTQAGFQVEHRKNHDVYRKGEVFVTTHLGDRVSPRLAGQVRQALRRAELAEASTITDTPEERPVTQLAVVPNPKADQYMRRPYTEEEDLAIIEGIYEGLTNAQIAEKLGRTESSVQQRAHHKGFKRVKPAVAATPEPPPPPVTIPVLVEDIVQPVPAEPASTPKVVVEVQNKKKQTAEIKLQTPSGSTITGRISQELLDQVVHQLLYGA